MIDGLRTRARAARRLTVLTGLVFAVLPASAPGAVPDPEAAVDQVLSTTTTATTATPEVATQLQSSADETVAAAPPVVRDTVEAVSRGDVEAAVGGTARALEDVGRQTTSRLDATRESVSTLELSPRVTADPARPDGPTETATRSGGDRDELGAGPQDRQPQPPSAPSSSSGASGGLAQLATADRPSMAGGTSSHAAASALSGDYGLDLLIGAASDGRGEQVSSAMVGRDGMHGSRAPAASASGAGGGTSAPPSLALALLLVTLATPILLRMFKEAPAFLRPAPYVALLERPG